MPSSFDLERNRRAAGVVRAVKHLDIEDVLPLAEPRRQQVGEVAVGPDAEEPSLRARHSAVREDATLPAEPAATGRRGQVAAVRRTQTQEDLRNAAAVARVTGDRPRASP